MLRGRFAFSVSFCSPAPSQGITVSDQVGTDWVLRRVTGESDPRDVLTWDSTKVPDTTRRVIDLVVKVPGRLHISRSAEIDLHGLDGKGAHKAVQHLKNELAEEFFHQPGVQHQWDEVKDVAPSSQKKTEIPLIPGHGDEA